MRLQFGLSLGIILLWALICAPVVKAATQTFDADSEGWIFYGDGIGEYRPGIGASKPGCLFMSCNLGETSTVYKHIKVSRGRNIVTAHIRTLDIQKARYGALWIFYQASDKTIFPSKDISGSNGWSLVTFTIDAKQDNATIWFRLRAPGMVWVDDVTVSPYQGDPIPFTLTRTDLPEPTPGQPGQGVQCPDCMRWTKAANKYCPICGHALSATANYQAVPGKAMQLMLGFEKSDEDQERGCLKIQGTTEDKATQGQRSGIVSPNKYINFDLNRLRPRDWTGFDYIALDVYNPTNTNHRFALAIGDSHGSGYWKELNHYSILTPGWNRLKFKIHRFVGERGSVKVRRYLDLRQIKKMWFRITHEDKGDHGDYLIDNIRLVKGHTVTPFPGLKLFDFVKDGSLTQPGFVGVESRCLYHKAIGFGFQDAELWRTHDSVYADTLNRDGIFILKGKFVVDLPNGKYIVRLVPSALGYWGEHFWTKRKITVEGQTLVDETRDEIQDFLQDELRFQRRIPTPEDNPFDLYLSEIFKPLVAEVTVSDGQLTIECQTMESGILLNSLIIYPASDKAQGDKYLEDLHVALREDFSTICRDITRHTPQGEKLLTDNDRSRGYYAALIDSDVQLRYTQIVPSIANAVELEGGRGQRPIQAMMVRNLKAPERLTITCSDLKDESGHTISSEPSWLRYGVQQFQSITINHEVFELAPRFLEQMDEEGILAKKDESLLIWLQIPITDKLQPGVYTGNVTLALHQNTVIYPVTLRIYDYTLPKPDVAVGFFGLNPINFSYYQAPDIASYSRQLRREALKQLAIRGFTTWAGLPSGSWKLDSKNQALDAEEVDVLMATARELGFTQKVFSYSGWGLVDLDKHGKIGGLSQQAYRTLTAELLSKHMKEKQWLPVVLDITDEATGYAQTVSRDLKRAETLRKYYPFLGRGGYSQPIENGKPGADLNLSLTDISLSSQNEDYARELDRAGINWGLYNQAAGLFQNGRYAYGIGMYQASEMGLKHQLGWCLTGEQNYPYYDLDGREFDAMMIFPKIEGGFDYAIKFEWATQGVEDYRLLRLLESLIKKGGPAAEQAAAWLRRVQVPASGADPAIPSKGDGYAIYKQFRRQLYDYILELSN